MTKRSMPAPGGSADCLILGATGRLGRLLAPAFAGQAGQGLHLRPQTRHANAAPGWILWDPATGPAALATALGSDRRPDCLLCLAGVTPATPGARLDDNTALALAALTAARHLGIGHVFLASSAAVYGNPDGDAPLDAPLSEDSPCAPQSDYGRAKLAMEQAALTEARTPGSPSVTCLRIGNVAGADQLLLNAAGATVATPLMLDRFADGQAPRRSYIGPVTLAAVLASLIRAAAAGQVLPECLNIAAPGAVSMADLLAAAAAQQPVYHRDRPAPKEALPLVQLDTSRLERLHRFTDADSTAIEMVRQARLCHEGRA